MKYPNTGSLAALDSKFRKSEKSPNATGKIGLGEDMIEYINQEHRAGRDVYLDISAWTRETNGKKWYSLKVQKHYVKEETKRTAGDDDESDVPF